jgi:hypothetical protein
MPTSERNQTIAIQYYFPLDYTLVLLHRETLLASFVEIRGCSSLQDSHDIKKAEQMMWLGCFLMFILIFVAFSPLHFLNLCRNISIAYHQ